MSESPILSTRHGRVGVITLNRPAQLNALNDALMDAMGQALLELDADPDIGAIVITGNEKAFAAGADIGLMATKTFVEAQRQQFVTRNWETIRRIRKPVIAAVGGFALGGGCELAMMCDFIIAADTAKFGQPEIKLGTIPGAGGTQRLPRLIGASRAKALIFSARRLAPADALAYGVIDYAVAAGGARERALALAREILPNGPIAVRAART
jgi:enoyl-CoA hydratase